MAASNTRKQEQEHTQERVLRVILWTFVVLTELIAIVGVVTRSYEQAAISSFGGVVYGILLLFLPRLGPVRCGYLCTLWYFLLATGAMLAGRGIVDSSVLLFPAGMFMGALLLKGRHVLPLIILTVVVVSAVGLWKLRETSSPEPVTAANVVVVAILLLVAGLISRLIVNSLQEAMARRTQAEAAVRQSNIELEAHNRALKLINELSGRLQHTLKMDEIASETLDLLVRQSAPDVAVFFLLTGSKQGLDLIAERGLSHEERKQSEALSQEGSLTGLALAQEKPVCMDVAAANAGVGAETAGWLAGLNIVAAVSIPIVFSGRSFGSVDLLYRQPRTFAPLELELFQEFGRELSMAVANARHLARLEHMAFHDALTSLPNRSGLQRTLQSHLLRNEKKPFGLMLFDLNRFREINEALGHEVGDELLMKVAGRLRDYLPWEPSAIFRMGGDEFAILLPGLDSPRKAEILARNQLSALRQPIEVSGMILEPEASLGVAIFPDHGDSSHGLLRCAEVAMYHAKKSAGGVAVYSPEFDIHTPERLALVAELSKAIRDGAMALHFQPTVKLNDRSVVGIEALLRWPHPQRGMIPPSQFLPYAEACDVIHPLTQWVVENALTQLHLWNDRYSSLTMSVNLSVRNLLDPRFAKKLDSIIKRTGVDPSHVEFELTETSLMTDPETIITMLGRITEIGAHIAIDDFGAGYTSLAYLKRFPVHTLKIDQSFIRDMKDGGRSRAIVNSTVHLARSLDLVVVAEGVEDPEVAEALRDMGCDLGQGYYFSRPLPAAEIERQFAL